MSDKKTPLKSKKEINKEIIEAIKKILGKTNESTNR